MAGGNGTSETILSPTEIKEQYLIKFTETADSGEIRRANAELVNKYHEASFKLVEAKHLYEMTNRDLRLYEAEMTLQVASEERDKPKDSRLSVDEKKAEVIRRVARSEYSSRITSIEYYFELWKQVVDDLKFVAKRVESATILDTSERKLQMMSNSPVQPDRSGTSVRRMSLATSWDESLQDAGELLNEEVA